MTAIEVLIVITILAMVMGLLFPAVKTLRRMALKTQAATEARQIVQAAKSYRAAYGKWPGQQAGSGDGTYTNNSAIMGDFTNNPRRMTFIEFSDSAVTNGCYVDPWRNPYVVAFDEDGDGTVVVTTPEYGCSVRGETVAVLSWGPPAAGAGDTNRMICSWKR